MFPQEKRGRGGFVWVAEFTGSGHDVQMMPKQGGEVGIARGGFLRQLRDVLDGSPGGGFCAVFFFLYCGWEEEKTEGRTGNGRRVLGEISEWSATVGGGRSKQRK